MNERKIRIRQLPDGRWAASTSGWLDFYVMVVRDEGYEAAADAGRAASIAEPVVTAPTPWEASAGACEVSGEDLAVEWETLPWTTLREAHGIAEGVTHILGASLEARRAIGEAMLTRKADAVASAMAAATDATRCLLDGGEVPSRSDVEQAIGAARAAARWLPGYGPAVRLLGVALGQGYPERRRARRLMERAWSALVAANARNDIAPDSR